MARNSNSFTLRGFVGRDAEVKTVGTGKTLAQFNLCASERWQTADGRSIEKSNWFRITCWGRQAEIAAARVLKGTLIEVHGRLESRQWERDGQTQYATDLVASELVFIDKTTGQPITEQQITVAEAPAETAPTAEQATAPASKPRRRRKPTA
jgi:single-strand DNA-binding protein